MTTRWEITKAVRASDLPSPARLVMFVLCDVAEVGTAEIPERFTPSVTVLERETGLSRSTVQRHLSLLEASGWVVRTRPATPEAMWSGERVRYQLAIPRVVSQQDPQVSEQDQGGVTATQKVVSQPDQGGVTATPQETDLYRTGRTTHSLPRSSAAKKTSEPKPTKQGTRLPDDFKVTSVMVAWARQRVPDVDGRRETEKFVNYWRAKSGKDATKRDWAATWRNWMLNAAERYGHPNGRASPSTAPVAVPPGRECPEHPGQDVDTCRDCRARQLAKPRRPP